MLPIVPKLFHIIFINNLLKNLLKEHIQKLMSPSFFQVCSHNRHRSWIHFDDALADSFIHALVFPGAWLRSTASVLNEEPAGAVTSWMSSIVVLRIIKSDTTTPLTRARVNKLSRCQSRTIRILKRTPTQMSHYRIMYSNFFSSNVKIQKIFSEKDQTFSEIYRKPCIFL